MDSFGFGDSSFISTTFEILSYPFVVHTRCENVYLAQVPFIISKSLERFSTFHWAWVVTLRNVAIRSITSKKHAGPFISFLWGLMVSWSSHQVWNLITKQVLVWFLKSLSIFFHFIKMPVNFFMHTVYDESMCNFLFGCKDMSLILSTGRTLCNIFTQHIIDITLEICFIGKQRKILCRYKTIK